LASLIEVVVAAGVGTLLSRFFDPSCPSFVDFTDHTSTRIFGINQLGSVTNLRPLQLNRLLLFERGVAVQLPINDFHACFFVEVVFFPL
jgi:hypothetical protein